MPTQPLLTYLQYHHTSLSIIYTINYKERPNRKLPGTDKDEGGCGIII
ncbi:MAG: hypothetical protein QM237_06450 [Bacteroidota bacterium]|nr:hypothetical protein [Bacteroidota bacterium]HHU97459.1 hypothetical protein [Petrimonas sp.]